MIRDVYQNENLYTNVAELTFSFAISRHNNRNQLFQELALSMTERYIEVGRNKEAKMYIIFKAFGEFTLRSQTFCYSLELFYLGF